MRLDYVCSHCGQKVEQLVIDDPRITEYMLQVLSQEEKKKTVHGFCDDHWRVDAVCDQCLVYHGLISPVN